MKSISQINKRYPPHELKTRIYAVETYRNGNSIDYVCRKYHISRISLRRWDKKYDGTPESLMDKSHRPISRHQSAHTDEEIKWIKDLIRRNPHITLCELWIKLKINKGYNRHIVSLYRVLKRIWFIINRLYLVLLNMFLMNAKQIIFLKKLDFINIHVLMKLLVKDFYIGMMN